MYNRGHNEVNAYGIIVLVGKKVEEMKSIKLIPLASEKDD